MVSKALKFDLKMLKMHYLRIFCNNIIISNTSNYQIRLVKCTNLILMNPQKSEMRM